MPVAEMNISQFLRKVRPALEEVELHDLRLNRRDGADLYLKRADREEAEHEMLVASGQLLGLLLMMTPDSTTVLSDAIARAVPWSRFLPDHDREEFAKQFIDTIEAAASLENYAAVGILLKQWKNTAEVWADPALRAALDADIEEGAIVERPAEK